MNSWTILYVGEPQGTCLQRQRSLREMGHRVLAVDSLPSRPRAVPDLAWRALWRLWGAVDTRETNRAMLEHVRREAIDLVWVDKGLTVRPQTLQAIKRLRPQARIVSYNPDDPFGQFKGQALWRRFLACLPWYDVCLVPREENVAEYRAHGARRALHPFPFRGFDPVLARPIDIDAVERVRIGGPVGFIGSYERMRADSMLNLQKHGVAVRIWGDGWARLPEPRHRELPVAGPGRHGEDYTRTICAFDINLSFLRHANRDQSNSRCVEIPACGAFMLAERSGEMTRLFAEGREAEFFASDAELLDKARHYLQHPDERRRVAAAGRARCLGSGYSYPGRLAYMLELIWDG